MKKIFLSIVIISMAFFSCQDKTDSSKNEHEAATEDSLVNHEASSPVILNNGEKWIANPETTEGIMKMKSLINEVPQDPPPGYYPALKLKLLSEFNLILQRCTMKGEAHTQLHNYLLPMQSMFEELLTPNAGSSLEELKNYLKEYEKYFQ